MGENQSKSQNNGGNAPESSTQARSAAHNVVRASQGPQTQQRPSQSSDETIQQRQRRYYEQRLRETQQELSRTAEERTLDDILRQQVQAVEISQSQQQLTQDNTSSPQAQVLERNRTPYNLTHDNLQRNRETLRPASQNASPTLYPNLNLAPKPQSLSNTPQQRNNRDLDSYVFVNSNLQSPGVYMSNFAPSAPPAPNSGNRPRGPNKRTNNSKPAVSSSRPADCSTCGKSYGLGKIYQCGGDKKNIRHSSCVECKAENKLCGICDAPISSMRNLGLETKLGDVRKINNLSSHINDVHPDCRRAVDTEIQLNNIVDPCHTKSFIDLDGTGPFKFIFHTKVNAAQYNIIYNIIFMAVQLFTARNDKNTWSYEIHVFDKRKPRRKLLYTDVCHPSFTPIEDIFGNYKCVSIPVSYAMTYFNEGSLTYKIYIKSNYQQSEPSTSGWKGLRDNRGKIASS